MFFLVFILLVCGMTAFDWWWLRCAFLSRHPVWAVLLLAFMLALLLLPPVLRHTLGKYTILRIMEEASWIWLAWSFWLAFCFCGFTLWNLTAKLFGAFHLSISIPMISAWTAAWAAIALTLLATIWGVVEADAIRVKTVKIASPRVPKEADGYRIALVSDVHLGGAATWRRLEKTVRLVNATEANLILSAGDLIDGKSERERQLAAALDSMHGAAGCQKLAVTGNHDVYSGLDFSRQCHEAAGFLLLDNAGRQLAPWLWIYGEKDPASGWHPGYKTSRDPVVPPHAWPTELKPESGVFRLLLKHRPDGRSAVFGEQAVFDLALSGHSHGGQIFPFNLLVRLQHPFTEGRLHRLPNGMGLYVSPGTGVWGPPFRVLARPEVTLFILTHSDAMSCDNSKGGETP
jgi:predicted MPP superfamily phosphohydrolase